MEIDFRSDQSLLIYTIQGKIEPEDMKRLQEIQESIPKNKRVKILAIVHEFDGYTNFEAAKEAFLLDFAWIGKADKYAMLSKSKWLKEIVNGLGLIVPKITFKTFSLKERTLAIEWLLEDSE